MHIFYDYITLQGDFFVFLFLLKLQNKNRRARQLLVFMLNG